MRTEGNEIHESTDEARAGSTPNIVRWVLAISLLGAIVLLSIIWMTGAATTDEEDRVANVTDRAMNSADDGDSTDSIVSDRPELVTGSEGDAEPARPADPDLRAPETAETPE